ncbi:MAG: hypothetical protein AAGH64_02730 [Planctomycetota bacterium]
MTDEQLNGLRALRTRVDACRRELAEGALELAVDEPTRHFAHKAVESFARLGDDLRRYEFALMHCGSRGA